MAFHFQLMLIALTLNSVVLRLEGSRIMQLPLALRFNEDIKKSTVHNHNKTVVCMFDSWSHWRVPESSFKITDIDPNLCTQLVYRNAGIDNTTYKILIRDQHLAESLGWYTQIVDIPKKFPHLKVLLSVGGWNEGSWTFSEVAADYKKRAIFVESVLRIMEDYGFHGLDFAWEYPTWKLRGGLPSDKDNLPLLLKDLRDTFGTKYLLSLTVTGDRFLAREAYDAKAVSRYIDQFNVRAFDYSGGWNNRAYHHSALKTLDSESLQSVENTIQFYLDEGAPADKIVAGIEFYGRTFLLKTVPSPMSMTLSGLGAPSSNGFGGNWIPDPFVAGYHELCKNLTNDKDNWNIYWDNLCMVPFARNGKRWVSFDNPESIESKVQFFLDKGLKGVMAWAIDSDDFKGTSCTKNDDDDDDDQRKVTYPLLRSINYAIFQEEGIQDSRDLSPIGNQPDIPPSADSHDEEKKEMSSKHNNLDNEANSSSTSSVYKFAIFISLVFSNFNFK